MSTGPEQPRRLLLQRTSPAQYTLVVLSQLILNYPRGGAWEDSKPQIPTALPCLRAIASLSASIKDYTFQIITFHLSNILTFKS